MPNSLTKFGEYGGQFAPEILMCALEELEEAFNEVLSDEKFWDELNYYLREFAGRPTPLYRAENLSKELNTNIYLKREDLVHGGAHKLNNTLGQALLAKKMGKNRIIAETGAGQHGVATAIAGAMLGLRIEVYMGTEDIERQRLNVFRMKLLGAKLNPVSSGSKTLKDAVNESMRDWVARVVDTYYLIGSIVGPHPYPTMVREFQRVIGKETKEQIMKKEGKLPTAIVACVGGGSNAIGTFYEFLDDDDVELYCVEAGGKGVDTKEHGASLYAGSDGVLHGMYSKLLQDKYGQIQTSYSLAPGLDYPGVGPELTHLYESGRVKVDVITDDEALYAFQRFSELEGIIPALESAHALAYVMKSSDKFDKDDVIVVNLSGRGDKDVDLVAKLMGTRL